VAGQLGGAVRGADLEGGDNGEMRMVMAKGLSRSFSIPVTTPRIFTHLKQESPVIPATRRDDGRVDRVEGDGKDGVC